jgi:hypothetical protein
MVSRVSYLSPCSIIHEAATDGVGEGLCYRNRSRIGTHACFLVKSGENVRLRVCIRDEREIVSTAPSVLSVSRLRDLHSSFV